MKTNKDFVADTFYVLEYFGQRIEEYKYGIRLLGSTLRKKVVVRCESGKKIVLTGFTVEEGVLKSRRVEFYFYPKTMTALVTKLIKSLDFLEFYDR